MAISPPTTVSRFGALHPHSDRRVDGTELVSYTTLRRVVGLLGVVMPIAVAIVGFVVMGWWQFEPSISDYYYLSATGMFLTLGIFALLFRQSKGFMTPEKRKRNAIYPGCAIVIFLCIATLGVGGESLKTTLWLGIPAFYALETLALWAFGVSWFIKGETLFKDKTPA